MAEQVKIKPTQLDLSQYQTAAETNQALAAISQRVLAQALLYEVLEDTTQGE